MSERILKKLGLRRGRDEENRSLREIERIQGLNEALSKENLRLQGNEAEVRELKSKLEYRVQQLTGTLNQMCESFDFTPFPAEELPTTENLEPLLSACKEVANQLTLAKVIPGLFDQLQMFDQPVSVLISRDGFQSYQAKVVKLTQSPEHLEFMGPPWRPFPRFREDPEEKVVVLRTGKKHQSVSSAVISACSLKRT